MHERSQALRELKDENLHEDIEGFAESFSGLIQD